MMNDTVREELQTKISSVPKPKAELEKPAVPEVGRALKPALRNGSPSGNRSVATIAGSPKSGLKLVGSEIIPPPPPLPEWRLQLQDSVRLRRSMRSGSDGVATSTVSIGVAVAEARSRPSIDAKPKIALAPEISDLRVANALKRIADSRRTFTSSDARERKGFAPRTESVQESHFSVFEPNDLLSTKTTSVARTPMIKPKLISSHPVEGQKRITNKLLPLERLEIIESVSSEPVISEAIPEAIPFEMPEVNRIHIAAEISDADENTAVDLHEPEIDDLANFSSRFSAGLFDFIIGGFASMLILSPVAFAGADWFTFIGLLTFCLTIAVVLFIYMTVALGFFGKTFGMRLFSLELVDAVENDYPTIHQAAVSSSVFLLSTAALGIGFLTVFFNEERRAAHDLASGTILIREF